MLKKWNLLSIANISYIELDSLKIKKLLTYLFECILGVVFMLLYDFYNFQNFNIKKNDVDFLSPKEALRIDFWS